MILHVFNCDNDLALANFSPGFTPAATIRQMMEELAELPLAWSASKPSQGEQYCVHQFAGDARNTGESGESGNAGNARKPGIAGKPERTGYAGIAGTTGNTGNAAYSAWQNCVIAPWGWSPAVCHRLQELGVPSHLLPSREQLLEIRRLSSRERAVELLREMRETGICTHFQSEYCTSDAQVQAALYRWPEAILKAPWSGSGKGLRFSLQGQESNISGWYRRVIQQQGGVVVEPLYKKVYDLAMEFYSDGEGNVTYQGLSLFETHANGAYRGNLLMPEEEKQNWLNQYIPAEYCLAVRQWLEAHLAQCIGSAYKGYLGVDMMVVKSPAYPCKDEATSSAAPTQVNKEEYALHPMVEVNLRMTMGMVSILLQQQMPHTFHGVFRLEYYAQTEELEAIHAQLQTEYAICRPLAKGAHYFAYVVGKE